MCVLALAFGLIGTASVFAQCDPATEEGACFEMNILPASTDFLGGSAAQTIPMTVQLVTTNEATQGWQLGVYIDADAGASAEITSLQHGAIIDTINGGGRAGFPALNWFTAVDVGSSGSCNSPCASLSGATAFTQGITIDLGAINTLPATPAGITIVDFTLEASGDPGTQVRLELGDVGDPVITTIAVAGGLSYTPATLGGAVVNFLEDPRPDSSQFTMAISDNEGSTNDVVDVTVSLNFDGDPANPNDNEVQGWSYGVCLDPAKLSITDATSDGTDTATAKGGAAPDFDVVSIYAGGVTHAVTVSLEEPLVTIPAQNDWSDLVVSCEILMDVQGDVAWLTPCNESLGDPVVRNVMSIEGQPVLLHAFEGTGDEVDDPVIGCKDPASCNDPGAITAQLASLFIPGSANGDSRLDIADGVYILNWLFRGGPPPPCEKAADANNDCAVDASDAVYVIEYQFLGGPAPVLGTGCQAVELSVCPSLTCEVNECTP
jgi:hypothetical protein